MSARGKRKIDGEDERPKKFRREIVTNPPNLPWTEDEVIAAINNKPAAWQERYWRKQEIDLPEKVAQFLPRQAFRELPSRLMGQTWLGKKGVPEDKGAGNNNGESSSNSQVVGITSGSTDESLSQPPDIGTTSNTTDKALTDFQDFGTTSSAKGKASSHSQGVGNTSKATGENLSYSEDVHSSVNNGEGLPQSEIMDPSGEPSCTNQNPINTEVGSFINQNSVDTSQVSSANHSEVLDTSVNTTTHASWSPVTNPEFPTNASPENNTRNFRLFDNSVVNIETSNSNVPMNTFGTVPPSPIITNSERGNSGNAVYEEIHENQGAKANEEATVEVEMVAVTETPTNGQGITEKPSSEAHSPRAQDTCAARKVEIRGESAKAELSSNLYRFEPFIEETEDEVIEAIVRANREAKATDNAVQADITYLQSVFGQQGKFSFQAFTQDAPRRVRGYLEAWMQQSKVAESQKTLNSVEAEILNGIVLGTHGILWGPVLRALAFMKLAEYIDSLPDATDKVKSTTMGNPANKSKTKAYEDLIKASGEQYTQAIREKWKKWKRSGVRWLTITSEFSPSLLLFLEGSFLSPATVPRWSTTRASSFAQLLSRSESGTMLKKLCRYVDYWMDELINGKAPVQNCIAFLPGTIDRIFREQGTGHSAYDMDKYWEPLAYRIRDGLVTSNTTKNATSITVRDLESIPKVYPILNDSTIMAALLAMDLPIDTWIIDPLTLRLTPLRVPKWKTQSVLPPPGTKYIVCPVVESYHWSAGIIHLESEFIYDFLIFDSMSSQSRNTKMEKLLQHLVNILESRQQKTLTTRRNVNIPMTVQQSSCHQSGALTLRNIFGFFKSLPLEKEHGGLEVKAIERGCRKVVLKMILDHLTPAS